MHRIPRTTITAPSHTAKVLPIQVMKRLSVIKLQELLVKHLLQSSSEELAKKQVVPPRIQINGINNEKKEGSPAETEHEHVNSYMGK